MKYLKQHKELSLILSNSRLRAIAIYTICSSFVLWYGIEKIFLKNTLNLTTTQITSFQLVYMLTTLILEFPSSILSDRWSRAKTLALSIGCLLISSLLGGLSHSYFSYLISVVVWGAASSFHSGTSQALVYDSLKDIGIEKQYLKINVFFYRIFALSLFLSVSLGGYLLDLLNPRLIYFLGVPTAIVGIVAILLVKEPTFHKKDQELSAYKHVLKTVKSTIANKILGLRIIISALVVSVYASYVHEFSPLSYLKIGVDQKRIGLLTAIASTLGYFILGGLVDKFKARCWQPVLMIISTSFAVTAFITANWFLLLVSMFILLLSQTYANDINDAKLHDLASSSERASVASLSGLVGGIMAGLFYPLLNLSMNRLGDSGYLLVSALVGFVVILLSLYIFIKERGAS
jgi:MFS family permease